MTAPEPDDPRPFDACLDCGARVGRIRRCLPGARGVDVAPADLALCLHRPRIVRGIYRWPDPAGARQLLDDAWKLDHPRWRDYLLGDADEADR